jgi:hypothetical protein
MVGVKNYCLRVVFTVSAAQSEIAWSGNVRGPPIAAHVRVFKEPHKDIYTLLTGDHKNVSQTV